MLFGIKFLTIIFAISRLIDASPLRPQPRIRDTHPVPDEWRSCGQAPQTSIITLHVALRQDRVEELEKEIFEVSDHLHPRYGQHLTASQVETLIRPTKHTLNLVEGWLYENDAKNFTHSPARDWLTLTLRKDVAERLLDTTFYIFRHADSGEEIIRAPEWSLPAHLEQHIETIQPTTSFFNPKAQLLDIRSFTDQNPNVPTYQELVEEDLMELGKIPVPELQDLQDPITPATACNRLAVSPLCLRTMYGTLKYVPQVTEKNGVAIVNFFGEVSNISEIRGFLDIYRPDARSVDLNERLKIVKVPQSTGWENPDTPSLLDFSSHPEADLDAQAVLGINFPTPLTMYHVSGKPPIQSSTSKNTNEPFLTWLHYILAQPTIPQVISISYADLEQTVPPAYARRVCNGFAQLAARGVTVLVPSGDHGVGRAGICVPNDGSNRPTFLASFPASCPYVTTVGGTRFFEPEIVGFDARNRFVAGSGFSNYFPRPAYQSKAVSTYLQTDAGSRHSTMFNSAGRAYPDISAIGYHHLLMSGGEVSMIDGTSASTPAVAAIISLVNDALIADGKPPLGFLNPWLYSKASEAFTDVTIGFSTGCNTTGFEATIGWDAASGLGTPWFPKLKELAMQNRFRSSRPWYYGNP